VAGRCDEHGERVGAGGDAGQHEPAHPPRGQSTRYAQHAMPQHFRRLPFPGWNAAGADPVDFLCDQFFRNGPMFNGKGV
jgi:hypothetical protein